MSRIVLVGLLLSSTAFADLPDPQKLAAARALKPRVDAAYRSSQKLLAHVAGTEAKLRTYGVARPRPGWKYSKPSRPIPPAELAALNADLDALKAEMEQHQATCDALASQIDAVKPAQNIRDLYNSCPAYASDPSQCEQWKEFSVLDWPGGGGCRKAATTAWACLADLHEMRQEWNAQQQKETAAAAADQVFQQPASGTARQRAFPLPRKFVKSDALGRVVDALGIFDGAHPSRFVFLRKDTDGRVSHKAGTRYAEFSRTLRKGEAVLPIASKAVGAREVEVLAIDGCFATVSVEDVATAPIAGAKVMPLKATDLYITDDDGEVIAGPPWLAPDDTGFSLEEPNKWLDLLDPPEPRQQKFIEAKEKVVGCYHKQTDKLDPDGTLRSHFDVVTYGRGGDIEKVESARKVFDRKACGACGCRAFNEMKRKLVAQAIAPAQKKAFEAYRPVMDKLSKTDFVGAAKGAPRGTEEEAEHPI